MVTIFCLKLYRNRRALKKIKYFYILLKYNFKLFGCKTILIKHYYNKQNVRFKKNNKYVLLLLKVKDKSNTFVVIKYFLKIPIQQQILRIDCNILYICYNML